VDTQLSVIKQVTSTATTYDRKALAKTQG